MEKFPFPQCNIMVPPLIKKPTGQTLFCLISFMALSLESRHQQIQTANTMNVQQANESTIFLSSTSTKEHIRMQECAMASPKCLIVAKSRILTWCQMWYSYSMSLCFVAGMILGSSNVINEKSKNNTNNTGCFAAHNDGEKITMEQYTQHSPTK